jgi:hypothetical protein
MIRAFGYEFTYCCRLFVESYGKPYRPGLNKKGLHQIAAPAMEEE